VVRVVMAIDAIKHFDRHAEKAGCFPFIDASLHKPRGSSVPQGMRRDAAIEASKPYSALKSCLDRLDGQAIPLDNMLPHDAFGMPTPQVSHQARWDRGVIGPPRSDFTTAPKASELLSTVVSAF